MSDNDQGRVAPSASPSIEDLTINAEPKAPATAGHRLSTAVFAFEYAMIVTAILMMVVAYVLMVLWNNARLQYDQFDQILLKIAGYSTPQETPPEALEFITTVVSRIVLVAILFGLAVLAVRTRDRAKLAPGEAAGPTNWPRRLGLAAVVTAGLWGFVKLVSVLPSQAPIAAALVVLLVVGLLSFRERMAVAAELRGGKEPTLFAGLNLRGLAAVAGGLVLGWVVSIALGEGMASGVVALGAAVIALAVLVVGKVGLDASQPGGSTRASGVLPLVIGALAGLAVVFAVVDFGNQPIPGFIGLCLAFALIVSFMGPTVAGVFGAVVGAGLLGWYIFLNAGPQYDWTSGLTGILLLYVGFLGASMATHEGKHITVDAIRKSLKSHVYHLYNMVGDVVTLVFTGFLGLMAVRYLVHIREGAELHPASALPVWVAVVPIGFAFTMMVIRFGLRIAVSWAAWRRREPAPELKPELH